MLATGPLDVDVDLRFLIDFRTRIVSGKGPAVEGGGGGRQRLSRDVPCPPDVLDELLFEVFAQGDDVLEVV